MDPVPTSDSRRLSLEEWGALPAGAPGEWVDGQLVEDEEVGALHDLVVAWLIRMLGNWLAERDGAVMASDTRFAVTPTRGRKPDVYAYLGAERPPAHRLVETPPDLMIEVVSPNPGDARRDRVEKLGEYAAFGVPYYWICDPALQTLEVFELSADGRYAHALGASEGVVDVPGCPGLRLDLDDLWAQVAKLPEE